MKKIIVQAKTWCVAKPSASEAELIADRDFCCSNGVDCSVINAGGACFNPDTLVNHASVVMNSYYQKMGKNVWNCDFTKSGLITMSDPSKLTSDLDILCINI